MHPYGFQAGMFFTEASHTFALPRLSDEFFELTYVLAQICRSIG